MLNDRSLGRREGVPARAGEQAGGGQARAGDPTGEDLAGGEVNLAGGDVNAARGGRSRGSARGGQGGGRRTHGRGGESQGAAGQNQAPAGFRQAFAAFAVVSFRWVWMASLTGNSGRFAMILVGGWEAYRIGGHSALWPSLVSFFLLFPTMMFGLIAGSFADRLNRAALAAAGQAVNAAACTVAAVLVFTHAINLAGVLTTAAVVGVGNSIQGPAWQALIPALVGHERMVNAALATRIAQQGSELVGPAIGTVVLTTAGPGWAFALCAALYGGGTAMLAHVRHPAKAAITTAPRTAVRLQVAEGVSYIRRTSPLGLLFVWVTCHCTLTMATFGILPTIASVDFHGAAGVYGLLLTAFGAGAILGPVSLMALRHQRGPGWILFVTGVLSGAPLAVLGLTHREWLAVVMSMLAGMGQAIFMAMIYASVMRCAQNSMRGRVSSVQLSVTTGAMGMASLGWGALVSVVSAGVVLAAPGALFVVICLVLVGRVPVLNDSVHSRDRAVRALDLSGSLP